MIADIYIAAIITTILALSVIGGSLWYSASREDRPFLILLLVLMLPMNPLAFFGVRLPLDTWLATLLSQQPGTFTFIRLWYAPVTEELAKLWPLLIPWVYQNIASRKPKLHQIALAIGLGFGVGEAWTVAKLLSASAEVAQYPWYQLGGYMSERFMVCIMHAGFTGAALHFIVAQKRIFLGLSAAMLLHFMANFPIYLASQDVGGFGSAVWAIILQFWVLAYFMAMGVLLAYMAYGKQWAKKLLLGKMKCPSCEQVYDRPLFGLNLFHKRYERCPHCHRWHMVSMFNVPEENEL